MQTFSMKAAVWTDLFAKAKSILCTPGDSTLVPNTQN